MRLESVRAAGATATLDLLVAIGMVVVGKFVSRFYVFTGNDPDLTVDNIAVAIGPACVINETREVSPNVGVDHPSAVQLEAPNLASAQVAVLSVGTLLSTNLLAVVGNDAFILVDVLLREHPPAVQL